ncbi:hypothetical protein L873DRAFT_1788348 [Choiromyces venosus 120613-1]|uniref:Crinkler effector protein N-terminal domain-containing protein n=1 Tax=Choiromyces venosus 120613-1 TaxID=1336337 RepID=A0A3N4JWR6_9PEZI|nr:hypothetical protein L873DRAFT_1788348 [Choiromyces venosus 120613-1]
MSIPVLLFCLVYGEPFSRSFEVEIKRWKSVSALRDLIISKDPDYFRGTSARSLDLWKINIPIIDEETPQNPDLSNAIKLGPADKIARHFNNPINGNIHIIIKPPPPTGQLTERQLLMLRPLSLTYTPDSQRKKKTKTTTKSNWARTPTSVVRWEDFIHQASIIALSNTTPQYDKPTFRPYKVSGEEEVQEALNVNVLYVLSTTIGSNQMPKEEFRRSTALEKVQGKPDFILMSDNHLRLAIEVKTKWALSVDDIVDMYHDNLKDLAEHRTSPVSVIDPIKQIYGYMGHNQLQYGVLSTYERTWFLWRPQDNPGTLFISDVVTNLATNPTLLQCFAYIMSLARHNPHCPSPPASPPPPMDDYKPPDGNDDDGDSTYHPLQGSSSRSRRGRRGGTDKRGGSTNTGKRSQSKNTGKQRAAGNEQSKEVLNLHPLFKNAYYFHDLGTNKS